MFSLRCNQELLRLGNKTVPDSCHWALIMLIIDKDQILNIQPLHFLYNSILHEQEPLDQIHNMLYNSIKLTLFLLYFACKCGALIIPAELRCETKMQTSMNCSCIIAAMWCKSLCRIEWILFYPWTNTPVFTFRAEEWERRSAEAHEFDKKCSKCVNSLKTRTLVLRFTSLGSQLLRNNFFLELWTLLRF